VARLGIVDDDNPNAFTFGRTRNSGHLVITRGILKYCDREEAKSVVAHEMGHIVHNDFVVMTVVAAIPLVLYVIWRGFIDSMRYSHGSKKGSEYVLIVIAISYVAWLMAQFIALCVSRFREYYADDFAARSTGNANKLSSALVKIAYGMTKEGDRSKEEVLKDKRIAKDRTNNAMMFQDMGTSRAFAISGLSLSASGATMVDVERAREWDERNVWARLFELQMTHPLTSKRIRALSRTAQEQGRTPLVDPEHKFGPMFWGDFGTDVAAKYMAGLGIVMTVFFIYTMQWVLALLSATTVVGVLAAIYLALWAYPMGFKNLQASRIKDLIMDARAGPVHGKPVKIEGTIVGRGIPGLFFSEDLKLDDGSGIMLLDYHQVSKMLDFFVGIFKTQEKVGKKAIIEGWYRRAPVPYVEILRMNWVDDANVTHKDTCYTFPFMLAMAISWAMLGIVLLLLIPLGPIIFLLMGTAVGLAIILGVAWCFRCAYADN
jgi:Zn-dependent protease with chaperone function